MKAEPWSKVILEGLCLIVIGFAFIVAVSVVG